MIDEITREAGKALWKQLGEDALKKAVSTSVTEGIKAAIDIWKKRRIRKEQFEFSEWKKERTSGEEEKSDTSSEDSPDEEASEGEESSDDESSEPAKPKPDPGDDPEEDRSDDGDAPDDEDLEPDASV